MSTRSLRVLFVDENVGDVEQLIRELRRSGYEPVARRVDTVAAMVEAFKDATWDIVLSDFTLRELDASAALGVLKDRGLDLPFIIVSGTRDDDTAAAMKAGAHDYLRKEKLARLGPTVERELHEAASRASARRAERSLRRSQRQLAAAQEIAQIGSWELDLDTRMLVGSETFYQIYGLPPQDVPTRLDLVQDRIHRDDRPSFDVALTRLVQERQPFTNEHRILEAGGFRIVQVHGRPVLDDSSRLRAIFGTTQDVTERKKLHEQLVVSDRMASIGALAAGLAHEINNPLATVIANLDLAGQEIAALVAKGAQLDELQAQLRDAHDAAQRLRRITGDLKVLARPEVDDIKLAIDVQQLMESCVRLAGNEIRNRASLVWEYGEVPHVFANESRLGQVFLNLLVNAAQAIAEGKPDQNEIRVATRTDEDGRGVVEVADTGPGMSDEARNRLFQPFFSTKPGNLGTGLGLAICQRIVTDLGGTISVESSVGRGTLVRVTLPPVPAVTAPVLAPQPVATAIRRGRVLIIDDEPMIGSAIRRTLRAQHDVVACLKATEALDLIRAGERFDVILCDLMMPEMTGIEFHSELDRLDPRQAADVIFLTGGGFTPAAKTFLASSPNLRIEKPFDAANLRSVINSRIVST